MDKAEILEKNGWVEINIDDFAQKVKGILRERYPSLRCVACEKAVHNSGLVTPNPNYSPRFSHSSPPTNGEFCPLSTETRRFRGFSGNEKTVSTEIAASRRKRFMQFDNLCRAWLVCRSLRGGKGKLDQKSFIRLVRIADSFGIWHYSYLPDWGIPLLLMLMDNHPTPNGNSAFFYILKKNIIRRGVKWQNLNVRLEAHWVSDGKPIVPNPKKPASFLLEIPFKEDVVNDILSKEDLSWCTEDLLKTLHSFSTN
ncbi:hypothetical protein [Xenorhabdus griffiniae]|uniref:Uncharacterized protein n=1 Tax=Xenorhabdus griffiniae TaxID=351672 RepID=A0ABY9XD45_9GAMM|nr:hypothetical protein [Xenorhabdus griffiniae]MBD1229168.1 hypothetical protein [Xenorhabdus griffiniae]MBE8587808.1 hypothetical protein [Xenorhabdus griffiniae]WMV70835.1 hypothetical protein QL128_11405 [Xenorhabdus griffiniae]WNH00511.1 hypothetical protein QL112_011410 [Xenorhabdus griffiniae]